MDVPPGTGVTSDTAPVQAAMLRRAWFDVAANAAPQLADLPVLLDARLAELEAAGRLDEPSLLAIAEDASQYALEQGAGEVARALSKKLRRAIYEFLLALDAIHPAELAAAGNDPFTTPPAAPAAPPAGLDAEPRVPVALLPADVQGGDDSPAAGADQAGEPADAPPVPLWEQVSMPAAATREVYRVASREVTPVTDAAPAVEPGAEQVSEVGPEAEAAFPESEPGAPAAEADRDVEALEAEMFDGVGEGVDEAAEPVAEAEAVTGLEPEAVADDAGAPTADESPAVDEVPVDDATPEPPAAPQATWSPVVDVPAPSADAEPASNGGAPHGVKPPRDLLRVPRQFRRLPPLPGHADPVEGEAAEEPVLPGEPPASELTSRAAESVAAEAGVPAVEDETPAEELAVAAEDDEEDLLGVPALPWPLEAETVEEPVAEVAPVPDAEEEPEEELGLPFAPLAELPAELTAEAEPTPEPPTFEEALPELEPAAEVGPPVVAEQPAVEQPVAEAPAVEQPVAEAPVVEQPVAEAPVVEQPVAEIPAAEPPFAAASPAAAALPDPFAPAPTSEAFGLPDLPPGAPGAAAGGQGATIPWTPVPIAPPASPFPIAPREGFHLTDPGTLDLAEEPLPAPPAENPFTAAIPPVNVPPQVHVAPPAPPAPAAPAAPAAGAAAAPIAPAGGDADDPGQWRVRQSPRAQLLAERMAQKRREEAARAAFEAASVDDEHRGRKKRKHDDALPDLPAARRQLDDHLRRKRGSEAAALLQRLAQELGGRDIADLALDSGDRCRALGQSRSATNCYLAAWRADPLYETPLWRLSDICLNEQDIELAVGYLERIADLMRSRGDDEGAIGVYRKIAMIAPERQDVRDVIRLAKTTGRLDV